MNTPKEKLIFLVAGCISASIMMVVLGEYGSMFWAQVVQHESVAAGNGSIGLVQNAVVGLIGILGGYFAGKDASN
jgi:hypothetical protein